MSATLKIAPQMEGKEVLESVREFARGLAADLKLAAEAAASQVKPLKEAAAAAKEQEQTAKIIANFAEDEGVLLAEHAQAWVTKLKAAEAYEQKQAKIVAGNKAAIEATARETAKAQSDYLANARLETQSAEQLHAALAKANRELRTMAAGTKERTQELAKQRALTEEIERRQQQGNGGKGKEGQAGGGGMSLPSAPGMLGNVMQVLQRLPQAAAAGAAAVTGVGAALDAWATTNNRVHEESAARSKAYQDDLHGVEKRWGILGGVVATQGHNMVEMFRRIGQGLGVWKGNFDELAKQQSRLQNQDMQQGIVDKNNRKDVVGQTGKKILEEDDKARAIAGAARLADLERVNLSTAERRKLLADEIAGIQAKEFIDERAKVDAMQRMESLKGRLAALAGEELAVQGSLLELANRQGDLERSKANEAALKGASETKAREALASAMESYNQKVKSGTATLKDQAAIAEFQEQVFSKIGELRGEAFEVEKSMAAQLAAQQAGYATAKMSMAEILVAQKQDLAVLKDANATVVERERAKERLNALTQKQLELENQAENALEANNAAFKDYNASVFAANLSWGETEKAIQKQAAILRDINSTLAERQQAEANIAAATNRQMQILQNEEAQREKNHQRALDMLDAAEKSGVADKKRLAELEAAERKLAGLRSNQDAVKEQREDRAHQKKMDRFQKELDRAKAIQDSAQKNYEGQAEPGKAGSGAAQRIVQSLDPQAVKRQIERNRRAAIGKERDTALEGAESDEEREAIKDRFKRKERKEISALRTGKDAGSAEETAAAQSELAGKIIDSAQKSGGMNEANANALKKAAEAVAQQQASIEAVTKMAQQTESQMQRIIAANARMASQMGGRR